MRHLIRCFAGLTSQGEFEPFQLVGARLSPIGIMETKAGKHLQDLHCALGHKPDPQRVSVLVLQRVSRGLRNVAADWKAVLSVSIDD